MKTTRLIGRISILFCIFVMCCSKREKFFDICNESNQAMFFVEGTEADEKMPCGKCMKDGDVRWFSALFTGKSDSEKYRQVTIGDECMKMLPGCDGYNGTADCNCLASHIQQSEECFEFFISMFQQTDIPCEEICKKQLAVYGR